MADGYPVPPGVEPKKSGQPRPLGGQFPAPVTNKGIGLPVAFVFVGQAVANETVLGVGFPEPVGGARSEVFQTLQTHRQFCLGPAAFGQLTSDRGLCQAQVTLQ